VRQYLNNNFALILSIVSTVKLDLIKDPKEFRKRMISQAAFLFAKPTLGIQ